MVKSLIIMDLDFVDLVYTEDIVNEIKQLSNLKSKPLSREEVLNNLDILKDVEVIFSGWKGLTIDNEIIKNAPNLKIIFYGAGSIKKIVTDEFWSNNLRITTANSANAIPVAEYTLASIIFSLKNAFITNKQIIRERIYPKGENRVIRGGFNVTIGLISLGAIAQHLLKLLAPFDYNIIVYDPYLSEARAKELNVTLVDLETIFKQSDVVSLHTPLLESTKKMIKGEHFLMMKENSSFINTARGAIVDEKAMIDALKKRPDITAILDVVYPEPPAIDSPLYTMDNVFLTPHIAGSESNEVSRMGSLMLEEFKRYLNNEKLLFEVSKEEFERMA